MAYSSSDLAAIRTAIARGELEVEFVDRRVRYRSIAELERAEAKIAANLATPRNRQQTGVPSKGFGPCRA
jgi:hypothetical protein